MFRSNKEIYAQLIDDISGTTLAAASSLGDKSAHSGNKVDQATVVGKKIAEAAKAAGIENSSIRSETVINITVALRHWLKLREKTALKF